jgi:hypothetical protein
VFRDAFVLEVRGIADARDAVAVRKIANVLFMVKMDGDVC